MSKATVDILLGFQSNLLYSIKGLLPVEKLFLNLPWACGTSSTVLGNFGPPMSMAGVANLCGPLGGSGLQLLSVPASMANGTCSPPDIAELQVRAYQNEIDRM